jgi:hypothetical protein
MREPEKSESEPSRFRKALLDATENAGCDCLTILIFLALAIVASLIWRLVAG